MAEMMMKLMPASAANSLKNNSPVVEVLPQQAVVLLMQAHRILDHHRITCRSNQAS
jgi:hypothetical protein